MEEPEENINQTLTTGVLIVEVGKSIRINCLSSIGESSVLFSTHLEV